VFGEIVGGDESIEVGFQAVKGLVVEGPQVASLGGLLYSHHAQPPHEIPSRLL
jgi:hypothetical protein